MHETRLRNELGSERVKKCWPCVQVERGVSIVISLRLKCYMFRNVSPKVIQSMMFIKKKKNRETQPIHRSGLHGNVLQQINLQHCSVYTIYAKQNCFCYGLPYHYQSSVFRSLVSNCFVFPCGTDAFCLYYTAKKTLRVYGALVHIAPLFVCLAVSKDVEDSLWYDRLVSADFLFEMYDSLCHSFSKIKKVLNIFSFQLLSWPWLGECTFFTYLLLIVKVWIHI